MSEMSESAYVLILVFRILQGGSMDVHVFDTLEACEAVGRAAISEHGWTNEGRDFNLVRDSKFKCVKIDEKRR